MVPRFSGGEVGFSYHCINNACIVSASSSLFGILFGITFAIFALLFKQQNTLKSPETVGVWRRFGAFIIDYGAVLMVLSPITSLPVLVIEAIHTGKFQWVFYRDYARDTDWIFGLLVFSMFFFVVFYFYKHPALSRQTLGEYVAGYKIIPADEAKKASYLKRVFWSFLGMCILPVSVILALRNKQKQFWWDDACNTKAMKVTKNI